MSNDYNISSYFEDEIIVKKMKNISVLPLFCPVCEVAMIKPEDPQFYGSYQACSECSLRWAEPNREKWKKGWRPSKS